MVIKNAKADLLSIEKDFAFKDTSYSSFWLYNQNRDIDSEHLKDTFVNFYDKKELLSEFNITVAKNIISYWSEQGDRILDPFSGSFTTSFVAKSLGRNSIGIDISDEYYRIYTLLLCAYYFLSIREFLLFHTSYKPS